MNELTEENSLIRTQKGTQTQFEITGDVETIWMSQDTLATFFNCQKKDIIQALNNILTNQNINRGQQTRRVHYIDYDHPNQQAKHKTQYSIQVIIALGFELKTDIAQLFQDWARHIIQRHLTWGFSVNKTRLHKTEKRIAAYKKNLPV